MFIKITMVGSLSLACLFAFSSLSQAAPPVAFNEALPKQITSSKPWYNFKQLSQGGKIYRDNCAGCHGKQAQGASNWKQKDAQGRNQPPPLNGSGHDWHHRINELFDTIKYGTVKNGGGMPAWGGRLSDDEIISVIGWFQSRWPKETYRNWVDRPHH